MKIVVLGIDLGKNLCSLAGLDRTGAVVFRRRMKRGVNIVVHSAIGKLHGGDGSLLWGPPSWSAIHGAGSCCSADVPYICATLCEGPEERRARCGSDRGSGNTTDHAVCGDHERGATRGSVTPSCPWTPGCRTDSAYQSTACAHVGAGDHCTARAMQAGATPSRDFIE